VRLDGLDLARFAAFAGMVFVNFRLAAQVVPGDDIYSAFTGLLEGRAAALFVVLAGVGFALGRGEVRGTLIRAGLLFALGMANMVLFDADILHFYAVYFLVALMFVAASTRMLWLGAAGFILAALIGLILFNYERGWDWQTLTYADFWTLPGFLRHTFYNGWHPVIPWAAFFLIGMALGRMSLAQRRVQVQLLLWGSAVALITRWLAGLLAATDPELAELLTTSPVPPGPAYMLAASGSAVAAIGAALLVAPYLGKVLGWFTRPGRQALTLYLAHIYLGMGVMDEIGLLKGQLDPAEIFWISSGFIAVTVIYAWAWQFVARYGPLEAAMRALSHRPVAEGDRR
jgi:uncharacterized membrane protein YeiB